MTEASIVRPLVWDDKEDDYTAKGTGLLLSYDMYEANSVSEKGWVICGWDLNHYVPFATKEEAKAACQSDYERRILSALDLTAHDAAVMAEIVEHVAGLLESTTAYVKGSEFQNNPDKHKLKQKIAELMVSFVSDLRALSEKEG